MKARVIRTRLEDAGTDMIVAIRETHLVCSLLRRIARQSSKCKRAHGKDVEPDGNRPLHQRVDFYSYRAIGEVVRYHPEQHVPARDGPWLQPLLSTRDVHPWSRLCAPPTLPLSSLPSLASKTLVLPSLV